MNLNLKIHIFLHFFGIIFQFQALEEKKKKKKKKKKSGENKYNKYKILTI